MGGAGCGRQSVITTRVNPWLLAKAVEKSGRTSADFVKPPWWQTVDVLDADNGRTWRVELNWDGSTLHARLHNEGR